MKQAKVLSFFKDTQVESLYNDNGRMVLVGRYRRDHNSTLRIKFDSIKKYKNNFVDYFHQQIQDRLIPSDSVCFTKHHHFKTFYEQFRIDEQR